MKEQQPAGAGRPLTVVVVGASGDLATRKIFPALFSLFCQDYLPPDFRVVGYARTQMTEVAFRERIAQKLTCRYAPEESCDEQVRAFLGRCHYVSGAYDRPDGFLDLYTHVRELEDGPAANRVFFLAVPPSVFLDIARAIGGAGLVYCGSRDPWSRVVIEKPFGRDRASSDALVAEMGGVFAEEFTYRIDHYLGKEMVQNLMVLRFANSIFEPLWSSRHISSVRMTWLEDFGCEGRGGYFDAYGIIRDVMQNHLLQLLALTAMECPERLDSTAIRDAKVRVLSEVAPAQLDCLALGQYAGGQRNGKRLPGYLEEAHVRADSRTPTFASVVLKVANARWAGVPFLLTAGKATDRRLAEVRIRFHALPHNIFCAQGGCPAPNELVFRIQPDESIFFTVTSKVPGLRMALASHPLNLQYHEAFQQVIPDAYECLLLDVLRGERGLFIRKDELAASWDVFTPVLQRIDHGEGNVGAYVYGSSGPVGAATLAGRHGFDTL